MCRVAFISKGFKNESLLKELFTDLETSNGGDGNGIGGFSDGKSLIIKSAKAEVKNFAGLALSQSWDNGFLFHTRKASVGMVNDINCHPFSWGNTVTIHNGHLEGYGILKLMMYENIEKYTVDGWTKEKIESTPDSDILSYFITKHGFQIVPMMDCGTVMTMYPDRTEMYNGYVLQAIFVEGSWIFASEFSDTMGMKADQWIVFSQGSRIKVFPNTFELITGLYVDGKELCLKKNKRKGKKGKGKNIFDELIEVI